MVLALHRDHMRGARAFVEVAVPQGEQADRQRRQAEQADSQVAEQVDVGGGTTAQAAERQQRLEGVAAQAVLEAGEKQLEAVQRLIAGRAPKIRR